MAKCLSRLTVLIGYLIELLLSPSSSINILHKCKLLLVCSIKRIGFKNDTRDFVIV